MTGVLKTVGKIAGVVAAGLMIATGVGALAGATIIAGIASASTIMTIAGGIAAASSLLFRPKAPATTQAASDRLNANIDTKTPRKIAFGITALATDVRDQEIVGADQEYVHRFMAAASHKVAAIDELWLDDKLAWSATGGVTGDFSGYLTVNARTEGSAGNAINISARMGNARRYTGLAYLHLIFKVSGNSKKAESPFAQSIPSRMTIIGKGAFVYDPRLDSTVPGGAGSCRADDQATWIWNDNASRNPALQTLWYLLGWRIQNPVTSQWKLAVGKGIPPARIDLASFITAANLCDEPVTLAVGGTQPRYRSDGIFSEGDATAVVLDQLKASMNAELDDLDGKIRITVAHNDLATPIADFSEDDILGSFTWEQTAPLDEMFNVVRGTFIDPSSTSLYQAVDYPEVRITSPDGIDRVQTVNFQTVQNAPQAQRLAKQRIARMLYSGRFTATFGYRAWKVQKNDVIRLTFAPLGWTNILFRVVQTAVQVDGQVPMTLQIENADVYLWDNDERPAIDPADPTRYDPYLNPVYQDVVDPKYDDGTSINNLRPAEPGATNGANPTQEALLAQLDADAAAAALEIAALLVRAGDAEDRITSAEGELTTVNDTLITQGTAISSNATAISNLEGDLAEFEFTIRAGIPNLLQNGGFENELEGWTEAAGDWEYADDLGFGARAIVEGVTTTAILESMPVEGLQDGVAYTAHADVALMASGAGSRIYLDIVFLDASDDELLNSGESPIYSDPSFDFSNDAVHRNEIAITATAPTGTAKAYIRCVVEPGAGETVTLAGIRLAKFERGSEPSIYSSEAVAGQTFKAFSTLELDLASVTTAVATIGADVSTQALAISDLTTNLGQLETVVQSSSPNLLNNGGFENGVVGWDWGGFGSTWSAYDNIWGRFASMNGTPLNPAGSNAYIRKAITNISAGQTITVTGDLALFGTGGTGQVQFLIDWLDAGGVYIDRTTGPAVNSNVDFSQNGALRSALKTTGTAPAGAASALIYAHFIGGTITSATYLAARQIKAEFGTVATKFTSEASVTQTFQSLNGAFARAALTLDVNGYSTGWEMNNNGTVGSIKFRSDLFEISSPSTGERSTFIGGALRAYDSSGQIRAAFGVGI